MKCCTVGVTPVIQLNDAELATYLSAVIPSDIKNSTTTVNLIVEDSK